MKRNNLTLVVGSAIRTGEKDIIRLQKEIFKIAFLDLQLSYVFAGAKTNNIRSLKAQEKLPYISLHVEDNFPNEHAALEKEVKSPCVLHVVSRENFYIG